MITAFIAVTFISITCGLLSTYLILKGWSLYGDSLSHAVLPGIIVSLLLGTPVGIGIFLCSLLVTFTIQHLKNTTKNTEATILAYVTSTFMGIGFLLYYTFPPGIRINEILFGKIIGIDNYGLVCLASITLLVTSVVLFNWRTFALVFFDKMTASLLGIKVRRYEVIFYSMIAIAIMTSIRSVGSLLIVSLLITPGALGYILSKKLRNIMLISVIFSWITGVIGLLLSFNYDLGTGATIVSMQFIVFVVVFLWQLLLRRINIGRQLAANNNSNSNTTTSTNTKNSVTEVNHAR